MSRHYARKGLGCALWREKCLGFRVSPQNAPAVGRLSFASRFSTDSFVERLSAFPDHVPFALDNEQEKPVEVDKMNHHKSEAKLKWKCLPKTVMLIKKPKDSVTTAQALQIAKYIKKEFDCKVLVEPESAADLPGLATYSAG